MSSSLQTTHVVVSLDVSRLERIVVGLVREGRRLGQRVAVVATSGASRLLADHNNPLPHPASLTGTQ